MGSGGDLSFLDETARAEVGASPEGEVFLEPARRGKSTCGWTIRTREGKYLASRSDPEREAERIAAGVEIQEGECVLVLAPALPHLIRAARSRVGAQGRVLVLEPRPEVFRLWSDADRNGGDFLGDWTKDPAIEWIVTSRPGAAREALSTRGWTAARVVSTPAAFDAAPAGWEFLRQLGRDLETRRITAERFAPLLEENRAALAGTVARAPRVSFLKDLWKGKAAGVAGAGPSLAEVIGHLPIPPPPRRLPLVAVGTAVLPLVEKGIFPAIAVVTDPQPLAAEQVAAARVAGFEGPWLFFPTVSPGAVRNAGEFLFAEAEGEGGGPGDELPAGGTVATTAIGLALLMGAAEVILLGVDLSLPGEPTAGAEGRATHVEGTVHDSSRMKQISRFRSIENARRGPEDRRRLSRASLVPAAGGGETLTIPPFPLYIRAIERIVARNPGVRFVQTASRAARIRGAFFDPIHRAAGRLDGVAPLSLPPMRP